MDGFIKSAGLIFLAVILCLTLSGYAKQYTMLISLSACCMVAFVAVGYLKPVLDFFTDLQEQNGWDGEFIDILLKAVGIGIISDIAVLVCNDSGQASLGKAICFISTAVMLWLSLPLFSGLMELISGLLELV